MKISHSHQRGNVLLTVLATTGIIGISLASYLTLTSSQNANLMRAQSWNAAIPLAESGIEEALTQLYYNGGSNLAVNGWSYSSGAYSKRRSFGANYVVAQISSNANPTITVQGFVQMPTSTNYISRRVQVGTLADGMFMRAMLAKNSIDLNGNNIATDSFDSTDPNYSTGGMYDPAKTKDNGDVATNSGLVNSLNVGNADIYGHVATGPGGSISVGPNGAVGAAAWIAAGNHGIEPGWSRNDMNMNFPDVQAPFAGGAFTPSGGNYTGTNYTYLLTAGNYAIDSISMSGTKKMLVTGNAILWIYSSFSMAGQTQIILAPGATLKMYVGNTTGSGASASLGGNGIVNPGNAMNFQYFGMPSNTSLSYSGNAAFTGTVYAPNANFSLGGGGNNIYDFVGASVTSTVSMNGHFHFHYDENLGRIGPRRGYIVTSWNEI
ncbi:MAG: hypothetical protein HY043_02940 [Verrucomicrobia bacterium]|nr:hypothetical protein [Verrucomicrobiota bacterium]